MIHLDATPQVWGVTGNLGGGKTLSAVSLAIWGMERGYFVCSNVSLDISAVSRLVGPHAVNLYRHFAFDSSDFDPFELPTGSPRGSGGGKRVLVILDECAEWIDQYTDSRLPHIKRFHSWLRHSSKRSQDVILIVQRPDYLNKSIRLLVAKWLVVDDLRVWRAPVIKLRVPFMRDFVMQRVFDRMGRLVQGPYVVRKSYYGRFYNTAECLNSDGASICYEYTLPRSDLINGFVPCILAYCASLFVLLVASSLYRSRVPVYTPARVAALLASPPRIRPEDVPRALDTTPSPSAPVRLGDPFGVLHKP